MWIYGIFVPNFPSAFKLKFNWSQGSKGRIQPFHIRAVGDESKREEKRNLIYMSMMKIRRYWFTGCLYYKISIRIQTGHSPSVFLTEVPLGRQKDHSFTDYELVRTLEVCSEKDNFTLWSEKSWKYTEKIEACVWMILKVAPFLKIKPCLRYFLAYAMEMIGSVDHDPAFWAHVIGLMLASPETGCQVPGKQ